ncbi:MAG TPA: DUF6531 domain-containing protein, partial [Burkholderiales bacterium]|nr:DUF6531 domain-containing protein [Burkholderiales bacterium]
MPVLRLTHALVGALLALFALIAHAGEPKQLYYSVSLSTGQTMYTTSCSTAVLQGLYAACPSSYMAPGYPVVTAPPPGGDTWRCDYMIYNGTACAQYGSLNYLNATYSCGPFPTLADGTCAAPQPKKNLGPCDDCAKAPPIIVGNPINSATGNKYERAMDYQGQGPFPLVFIRHYNSAADPAPAPIGAQWRHHYQRAVTLAADGLSAETARPDGRVYRFVLSNGAWVG